MLLFTKFTKFIPYKIDKSDGEGVGTFARWLCCMALLRASGGPLHATIFVPISILREREGSRDFDDELLGMSFLRRMNCWKRMNLLDEEEDLDLDGENVWVEKELEVPNEEGEW